MLPIDLSEWVTVGASKPCHRHLWKQEPHSPYDSWAYVTDDYLTWEFRECVLCGTKQIRDLQS